MIRKRIVSAASRIQRVDAAMMRVKSKVIAAEILKASKEDEKRQALEDKLQEARDAYEQKCYDLEQAEIDREEAFHALRQSETVCQAAYEAEHAAHKALTKLEKES